MADAPQLRASDVERDQAAAEIREHFAAGRLSQDELDERVSAVYAARTHGELEALRADLPMLPATKAQMKAAVAERRAHLRRRVVQQSGGSLGLLAICVFIWLADGAQGQFWPIWVAIPVVLALVRNGWRLYGPAPEFERVERELARRESHGRQRQRHRRRT